MSFFKKILGGKDDKTQTHSTAENKKEGRYTYPNKYEVPSVESYMNSIIEKKSPEFEEEYTPVKPPIQILEKELNVENEQANISVFDLPRYKENPILLFFEYYVLDTIGFLPKANYLSLNDMMLYKTFNLEEMDWKETVKYVLSLSDTIEIAITDLWYRNSDIADKEEFDYAPEQFAMDFVDLYFKEDSKIDIWQVGELEQAKKRIEEYESR